MDNKYTLLKKQFIPLLQKLKSDDKGKWGVMNAQQMVEHFAEYVSISSGRKIVQPVYTGERLERTRQFLMTDTPFKENTPNSLLPDVPPPARFPDMAAAIQNLKNELDHFFEVFEKDPKLTTGNPFFGTLNFEENLQLLYKHALHHLRQFDLAQYLADD